ncbi:pilus assembly protein TadG-related protein [Hansschlegelia sp. KR7-227]|uniref:TadE/TadG family type IV pilus assembly protein n=1 Tax=Hansschlegelia sp. KR7-227 TaxID=3400914 RepID=UPI003C12629E
MLTRRFLNDASGNVAMILALLCVPLMLCAGGGVDLVLQERDRVRLQDALDAGLVAAAALAQPLGAEQTIRNYLNAGRLGDYALSISEKRTAISRTVTATATQRRPTSFLKLARIDELPIVASGSAEESYKNVELSLVLDLSGSMRLNSRITAMRPAAKSFIATLLAGTAKDYTTISLVPYAGQVNVGFAAFDSFAGSTTYRKHDKSSCFGIVEKTYTPAIPDFTKAEHVPVFSTFLVGKNEGFDPWNCPTEETSITYFSNDAKLLQDKIDAYHMFDGTATQIAMRWGLHLLDPAVKPLMNSAAAQGVKLIPAGFSDRPAPFHDGKTLKVIVLMTDGEVVAQQRPTSGLPVNPQPTKSGTTKQVLSQSDALNAMVGACADAKLKGVVVYTIGFDTNGESAAFRQKLKACASSPEKFYEAKTSDINAIFQDVARSIYPLRLTN